MDKTIVEFAPAKVNLALHVLGRRDDGFHDLDSCVGFAAVGDLLALSEAPETTLAVDGPFAAQVPVTPDNLVLRAYAALAAHAPLPPLAFRLTKNLPVASGIGGGSADAAAALRGITRFLDVRFDSETMLSVALSLGADVPVCLHGKTCRMQGVGEVISDVERLPASSILLVNPGQPCSTVDVFRRMDLKPGERFGKALDVRSPALWRNDMTEAACKVLPVIGDVLATLRDCCAGQTVRMSGSGATCFALFEKRAEAEQAAKSVLAAQPGWWVAAADLS